MHLTEKQKRVYDFIKEFIQEHDMPPSFTEIKEYFGFGSLNAVNDHIENLVRKGFLRKGLSNQKRSIALTEERKSAISLPLLGLVRAGQPIDVCETLDYVDVPEDMVAKGENVALRVIGNSMIESGICDGDTIIVRRQTTAENGQIVVALIDNQATIKEIQYNKGKIELLPHNSDMESILVKPDQDFQVYGVLVGMYRKY
jgi:repressor LexA